MAELKLHAVNLDSPDPARLARFYAALLGWQIVDEQADDVVVGGPGAPIEVLVQRDVHYRRPTWPSRPDHQRMMAHLDIRADDLAAAVRHAESCGAVLADCQPQDHVRVLLDPDGHPFCLFTVHG